MSKLLLSGILVLDRGSHATTYRAQNCAPDDGMVMKDAGYVSLIFAGFILLAFHQTGSQNIHIEIRFIEILLPGVTQEFTAGA